MWLPSMVVAVSLMNVAESARNAISSICSQRRRRELASGTRAGSYPRREFNKLHRAWILERWKVELVLAAITVATAATGWLLLPEPFGSFVAGAVLAGGLCANYILFLQIGAAMPYMRGLMGEEWSADQLRKLRRQGWRHVNHVMLENADVDHVALGPGGFFAVESKYRNDPAAITEEDMQRWASDIRRRAQKVKSRLRTQRTVRPVIVVWGPGSREVIPQSYELDGVLVCAGAFLTSELAALPSDTPSTEVHEAFDHLDDYVRRRDQGEAAAVGRPHRTVEQLIFDFLFGTVAALIVIWLIALSAKLPGAGWTMFGISILATAGAAATRRYVTQPPRLRAISTGALAASAGMFTAFVAAIIVSVWRNGISW